MLLGEELILLLLDDDSGRWLVPRRAVRQAVRGALVVELLARRAVSPDDHGVLVVGLPGATGGDPVLESAVRDVVGRRPEELARPEHAELWRLLERLRRSGVLRRGRVLRGRHLPHDPHPEDGVRARLREALTTPLRPDRPTALLAAILHEMFLLGPLFPDHDARMLGRRAREITQQLREDAHYVPTTLTEDARGAAAGQREDREESWVEVVWDLTSTSPHRLDLGDVLDVVGSMTDGWRTVVAGGWALTAPARALVRILGGLS